MMKLRVLLMVVCLMGISCLALADDIKVPNDSPIDPDRTTCLTTDYTGYARTENLLLAVVDQWYTVGPISIPAGCQFSDIMVDLGMMGTWIGDLIVEVYYDRNCDGTPEVGPISLLCRPNLTGCSIDGCCGCSGDVNGLYRFANSGTEAMGDPTCPTTFPSGNCYLPAPESPPLSLLNGETSGGCFTMKLVDAGAGDNHTLNTWEVWVKCGTPVPNEAGSWGQIKSIYR
jgi:hypothetical protein